MRPLSLLALALLASLTLAGCSSVEPNSVCLTVPELTISADPAPKIDWTPNTCGEPWLTVQDMTASGQPFVWTIVDTDTPFLPPITYGVFPTGHAAGTTQVGPTALVAGHTYKVTLYRQRGENDNFPIEVASQTFLR